MVISGMIGKTARERTKARSFIYCAAGMLFLNRPARISMAIFQEEISAQARVFFLQTFPRIVV